MNNEVKNRWAWICTTLAIAVGVVVSAQLIAARHDRAVSDRAVTIEQKRVVAAAELEQQKFVASLVREYLVIDAGALERRDRMAELIALHARDKTIQGWAAEQRKRLAPALERLEEMRRQRWMESMRKQGLDHADTTEDGSDPEDTPEWKRYNKARDRLRLKPGKLCCKITTGKILFARARSVDECRRHAQELCQHLASAAGQKQKCFYVAANDCASGEILGGGDVTVGEDKPGGEKKATEKEAADE